MRRRLIARQFYQVHYPFQAVAKIRGCGEDLDRSPCMNHPAANPSKRLLLSIIELGGYPDFKPLYRHAGYEVESVASVRKALGLLKKLSPDVIVAEFNFQSDFRDRTSSLESLLAVVQRSPKTRMIVFYETDHAHQLARLQAQFPIHAALAYPIDAKLLDASLR
jgi:hypothetical protein